MAHNTVYLEKNGITKEAPVGFSWTTLFFGFWPSLFRSDFKWFWIMLALSLLTFGVSQLVFMFMYNKLSIKSKIESGWKVKSVAMGNAEDVLGSIGIMHRDKK